MAETLYRKYRPQLFADLIGQQHVRVTLQNAIVTDRVAHAYLLAGPRGTGKTTTARLLARAVNCLHPKKNGEPCNDCDSCLAILNNRTLDIMEIDAASQTGVDNVRENIIQSARAFPALLKKKVFIIDEVHMLSLAAFNALLKLLEEPPAHAMFILATTDVHRVPETIISRTQRFDFQRIGFDDMVQRLQTLASREQRRLGEGVAERIARTAGGSLRDAEGLLGQVFSFDDREITLTQLDAVLPRSDHQRALEFLSALVPGQAAAAMKVFHTFVADGGDVTTFVQDVLSLGRNLLLLTVNRDSASDVAREEDAHTLGQLNQLAAVTSALRVVEILDAVAAALRQLPFSSIEELPVEVSIARVCLPPDGPSQLIHSPPSSNPPRSPNKPAPSAGPTKKTPRAKPPSLSLEAARAAWSKLQASPDLPPGLILSVKQAEVENLIDNQLQLVVPFSIHADRLLNHKNLDLIRKQSPEWANIEFDIRVETNHESTRPARTPAQLKPQSVSATTGDDLWDSLISTLGESA